MSSKKLSLLYLRGETVENLKIYAPTMKQGDIPIPDYLSLVHGCVAIIVKDVEEIPLKFIKNVFYLLKVQLNNCLDDSLQIDALKAREKQICCIWLFEPNWIKTWSTVNELQIFENRLVFADSIWDKKLMKILEENAPVPKTVIDLNKTVTIIEGSNKIACAKDVEIHRLNEELKETKDILHQSFDLNREASDLCYKWSMKYLDAAYGNEKGRNGLEYRILVDVYEYAKTVCEKLCELVLPLLRQSKNVSVMRNSKCKWPDAQFNETSVKQRMLNDVGRTRS
jgi:hypothetical protein